MKRYVKIGKTEYTLTYDEDKVLDTVVVTGTTECLSAKNKDVKKIINNADKIAVFANVTGISYI